MLSSLHQTKRSIAPRLFVIGICAATILWAACSTTPRKPPSSPLKKMDLSTLVGQKIALVSIEGEPTAQKIVEVALVNQLIRKGSFELISKQDVDAVRKLPNQDPTDWKGIARNAGADYALQVHVIQFEAPIREGYSTRDIQDTQLAREQGTEGKTEQVYKVKSMEGHVKIELEWTHLANNETRTSLADAQEKVEASALNSSIHLPPPLRFLEKLSNQAFHQIFGGS